MQNLDYLGETMTQSEFSKGWKLLILQPWGWRYRTLTDGKPSEESRSQLEFYYAKLQFGTAEGWMKVADLFAQGDDWPSVAELKRALQAQRPAGQAKLEDKRDPWQEPPDGVMALLRKIGAGKAIPPE